MRGEGWLVGPQAIAEPAVRRAKAGLASGLLRELQGVVFAVMREGMAERGRVD